MTFTDNEERGQKELSTTQRQLHDPQDSFSKAKTEDAAPKGKARTAAKVKMQKARDQAIYSLGKLFQLVSG